MEPLEFSKSRTQFATCNLTEVLGKTNSSVRNNILALGLIHTHTELPAHREHTCLNVTPNSQGCVLLYGHTHKMRLGM